VSKPIDPANLFETVRKFCRPLPLTSSLSPSGQESAGRADEGTAPPRDELPSFAELDTIDGLGRVGGNRGLYLKLLRQFVTQQANAAEQIAAQLGAGDHATAERRAHTVKGVAGNLGAKPVQTTAAELEKLIRDHADVSSVEAARQRLAENLGALVEQLRFSLGEETQLPAAAAIAVDPAQAKLVVEQMLRLLSEFDAAAGDSFKKDRTVFAAIFSGAELTRFDGLLENYNFVEAEALLKSAIKILPSA
jgi:two-component system sensor histidine kinase/response regulator